MSLGYEFAPIDVSITTHPKAFGAGVEAMGLWLWGMAYAKQHRTGGRLHRAAVLGAWGGRRNILHAKRLVEAGLWVAREDGDWDVHNFEKKSPGRQTSSADRMRRFRERRKGDAPVSVTGDVTPVTEPVTVTRNRVTECSPSPSPSPSVSVSESSPGEGPGEGPPEWFSGVIETIRMGTGADVAIGEAWLRYRGHRRANGKAMNRDDAEYWVTTVMVPEAREARDKAQRQRERDASSAKRYADHRPKHEPPTPQQSSAIANELVRRLAEENAKKGAA